MIVCDHAKPSSTEFHFTWSKGTTQPYTPILYNTIPRFKTLHL